MAATFGRLSDRGRDRGRLEPVEAGLEALIVACAGAAADEGQDLVWRRRHQAGGAQACVAGMDDLGGRPDQHVGVPDGRHAMFGYGLDANGDRSGPEIDRRKALRLGEREKWIGHQVLRIPRREVARERTEEIELLAPWSSSGGGGMSSLRASISAAPGPHRPAGQGGLALCGQHGSDAGIGGRVLGAEVGPGLEVVERIDDAAADLPVLRTGAIDAVLLQRATGEARESGPPRGS